MNQPEAMTSLYLDATKLARSNKQVVGEKNDNYITLEQLMELIRPYVEVKFDL